MRNRTLPLRRLGLALLVASTVFPPSAGAQSSCDLGFALTHGGVAEADINGDGLTCEFNTVDSITGVWTTIALDNVPPDISAPDQCPDHFVSHSMAVRCDPRPKYGLQSLHEGDPRPRFL